jgi:branched-chain amino acid transport system substrate-binding protein
MSQQHHAAALQEQASPSRRAFPLRLLAASLLVAATQWGAIAQAAETAKIGLVTSLTGGSAKSVGLPIAAGARLAVQRINAEGGIGGKSLTLIEYDDQGQADLVKVYQKAIENDKVLAIVGPTLSSQTEAAWTVSSAAGVPSIGSNVQAPDATEHRRYAFRTMLTSTELMKSAVHGAVRDLKPATVMAATQLDEQYSYQTYISSMPIFASLGVKSISPIEFKQAADAPAIVAAIKRANPDIVFLPLIARDATLVLLEMKKQGIKKTVVCNCGFLLGDVAPELKAAADNVYFSVPWSKDADDARNIEFLQAYRAAYKSEPSSQAALAYESVIVAVEALRHVKNLDLADAKASVNRDALAKELANGKHHGVSGSYRFARAGVGYNAERRGYTYKYQNGQIEKVSFSWLNDLF